MSSRFEYARKMALLIVADNIANGAEQFPKNREEKQKMIDREASRILRNLDEPKISHEWKE